MPTATASPTAWKTRFCDGIDNNDNGLIDEGFDRDKDGYTTCGTDTIPPDCNDADPNVHPGAKEIAGDLIDNDCDGLIDEGDWNPGDLFITEIMNNPYNVADPYGEWFEVHNASGRDLLLNGMVLTSAVSGDWHQVDSPDLVWLPTDGDFVFGNNEDTLTNGGVTEGYQYSDLTLSNEDDDLILMMGDVIIDEVAWDNGATFPDPQGASMNLDPDFYGDLLNDLGASWCEASFPWATNSDDGSPGQHNQYCWPVAVGSVDTEMSTLYTCDTLYLLGDGSYDPNGSSITYDWELVSGPPASETSTSDLSSTTTADITFIPDEAGTYVFSLTVFNGTSYSDPVYVTVDITERPYNNDPLADAGDDQTKSASVACTPISYGAYYTCSDCSDADFPLDASGTTDPDGDYIKSYAWAITGGTGSGSIDSPSKSTATLTMAGPTATYGETNTETLDVTLTVIDCMGASGDDQVTFTYECTGS